MSEGRGGMARGWRVSGVFNQAKGQGPAALRLIASEQDG